MPNGIITALETRKTKTGKDYYHIEIGNQKFNTFDPDLAKGLSVGDSVEFATTQNAKGFWELTSLKKLSTPLKEPETIPLRDQLILRQVAFKGAVEIVLAYLQLKAQDSFEVIPTVRIYTDGFERILKNEK